MTELERLRDRVEELEELIGLTIDLPFYRLALSPTQARLLGLLLKRDFVTRDFAFVAMYGGRPEADQPDIKCIDIYIHFLRKKLDQYGISIRTRGGYFMEPADKKRLYEVLQGAQA